MERERAALGSYEIARNRGARTREIATVDTPPQTLNVQTQAQAPPQGAPAEIANISSIVRKPNSHLVEVRYNQLVPQQIEGSLDDPAIRQLLMLASQNSASAGVRDDSVGLLAAECKAGHSCQAAGIRDALMVALRYDKNAGVREKALEGLEPYVAEDVRVRDAVLEALMNDAAPKIRTAAHQHSGAGGGRYQRAAGAALGCQYGRESVYPDCFKAGFEP